MKLCLAAALQCTAPLGGFGVQHLLGTAGKAQIQRELFVGVVLRVHDAQQVLAPALAQPCVHALAAALAGHPLKAVGVVLAIVEGGFSGIHPAQVGKVFLEGIVEGIFQQVPVQLPFFVPLPEVSHFVAHEVQLLARVHIHIKIENIQQRFKL